MCLTFLKLLHKDQHWCSCMSTCIRWTYLHLTSSVILSETTLSPRKLLTIQYISLPLSFGITVNSNLDVILERKYVFFSTITIVWSEISILSLYHVTVAGGWQKLVWQVRYIIVPESRDVWFVLMMAEVTGTGKVLYKINYIYCLYEWSLVHKLYQKYTLYLLHSMLFCSLFLRMTVHRKRLYCAMMATRWRLECMSGC